MAVSDTHVFPGFLTSVLTQFSFQSHQILFLTWGEMQKYAGKKVCLNWISNPQPPGHKSNTQAFLPMQVCVGWSCSTLSTKWIHDCERQGTGSELPYTVKRFAAIWQCLWHLSRTMPPSVQYGNLKIMFHILCKTEGRRPYQTHFFTTNTCFNGTQIYN